MITELASKLAAGRPAASSEAGLNGGGGGAASCRRAHGGKPRGREEESLLASSGLWLLGMVDGGLPFRAAMMDGEEGQRQAFFPEYYHGRPDGGGPWRKGAW